MAVLDIDKDVLARLERSLEINTNIEKQVLNQRRRLGGNTSDFNHVTLFYIDMTNDKPEIFYFNTNVTKEQMIRLNYDRPYFHEQYQKLRGKENLPVGDDVYEEIIEEVKDRFTKATQGKDITKLFVQDRLPQMI